MPKKNNFIIVGIVCGVIGIGFVLIDNQQKDEEVVNWRELKDFSSLFTVLVSRENFQRTLDGEEATSAKILLKEEHMQRFYQVRDSIIIQNTVVVYPLFTAAAYSEPGFYDNFKGECDESCLTVELKSRDEYELRYNSSGMGIQVLNLLGYKFITDLEIHKNPEILKEFDKVIMLHNEYVTRAEFDAITEHPNVVYLYPNALYAEIEYDENDNTIKLIRGHNYPEPQIINGFDWEFDNTHPYEFDMECNNWEFYEIDNGYMLNCYPEIKILNDFKLLETIKLIDFLVPEDEELDTMIELTDFLSLFKIVVTEENYQKYLGGVESSIANVLLKEENMQLYAQLRDSETMQNTVVVYPIFTAAAYDELAFYDYFREECDESCLTVELKSRDEYERSYSTSSLGVQVLNLLGYKFITDLEIHKNPEILKEFDKVIMLHNEYVTRAEFDAITEHPNVVYLYPNALYAEIEYDENDNTIKLIRGHNYPEPQIINGFDWEFDNTHPYEFDVLCKDWEFYEIDNGYMLNCYPEIKILTDFELLKTIKMIDFTDEK